MFVYIYLFIFVYIYIYLFIFVNVCLYIFVYRCLQLVCISAKPVQENLNELKQELDVDFHKVYI